MGTQETGRSTICRVAHYKVDRNDTVATRHIRNRVHVSSDAE